MINMIFARLNSAMANRFLLFITVVYTTFLFGQTPQLSDKAQISVMTCAGAPEVLYYSFGHTAFRVQDPEKGIDVVYNYGTFDFDQPNFYLNFTKGRLLYTLTRRRFDTFLYEYDLEKRWVKQQVLNLTPKETNQLFQFFEWNFLPENRDYLYDPLFENCSTVVFTILKDQFGEEIQLSGDYLDKRLTFRELVRGHLATNSWGSFGIDLAFGAVVDRTATVEEHTFLPYQAMYQIRGAKKGGQPLLRKETTVLNHKEKKSSVAFFTSPLFFLLLLFALIAWLTYRDFKNGTRNRRLDFWLLLVSGLVGFFLLFLWFGTNHVYTKNNWNILWLFPLNAVVAFFIVKNKPFKSWVQKYLWMVIALLTLTIFLWIFKVQIFSPLNLLLMGILGMRYAIMLKRQKTG